MRKFNRRDFIRELGTGILENMRTSNRSGSGSKMPDSNQTNEEWVAIGTLSDFPPEKKWPIDVGDGERVTVVSMRSGIQVWSDQGFLPVRLSNGELQCDLKGRWSARSLLSILTGEMIQLDPKQEDAE